MPHGESERAAILHDIVSAFAEVRLGGGISLHQARQIDDSFDDDPDVRRKDPETAWTDLADEKLRLFNDVFVFLDAEALRFYLPAFIGWVLRNADNGLDSSFEFFMCGRSHKDGFWGSAENLAGVMSILTPGQSRAIRRFMQYQKRPGGGWTETAAVAWINFWGRHRETAD